MQAQPPNFVGRQPTQLPLLSPAVGSGSGSGPTKLSDDLEGGLELHTYPISRDARQPSKTPGHAGAVAGGHPMPSLGPGSSSSFPSAGLAPGPGRSFGQAGPLGPGPLFTEGVEVNLDGMWIKILTKVLTPIPQVLVLPCSCCAARWLWHRDYLVNFLANCMLVAYLVLLYRQPDELSNKGGVDFAMVAIPFLLSLVKSIMTTLRDRYQVSSLPEAPWRLFMRARRHLKAEHDFVKALQAKAAATAAAPAATTSSTSVSTPTSVSTATPVLELLRAAEVEQSLKKVSNLSWGRMNLFYASLAFEVLGLHCVAPLLVDSMVPSAKMGFGSFQFLELGLSIFSFLCALWLKCYCDWQQQLETQGIENLENIVEDCQHFRRIREDFVPKEFRPLWAIVRLPATPAYWEQMKRLEARSEFFNSPTKPPKQSILDRAEPWMMPGYSYAFANGKLTASLLGEQLVLGPPNTEGDASCASSLVALLRSQLFVLMLLAGMLLPTIARSGFTTKELDLGGRTVFELCLELHWALVGLYLVDHIFLVTPRRFNTFCHRLAAAYDALNVCLEDPDKAASRLLPFVDMRNHRQLAMWREVRGLVKSDGQRDMDLMQKELGLVTAVIVSMTLKVFGSAWLEGELKVTIWSCTVLLCLGACMLELGPALFHTVILNKTLNTQVNLIRQKCHEVSLREVYSLAPGSNEGDPEELARSRRYAFAVLADMERSEEGFFLWGIRMDFKTLLGLASPAASGLVWLCSKAPAYFQAKQGSGSG